VLGVQTASLPPFNGCAGSAECAGCFVALPLGGVPGVLGVQTTSPFPSIDLPDVPGGQNTPARPAQKAVATGHHDRKWTGRLSDFRAGFADQPM